MNKYMSAFGMKELVVAFLNQIVCSFLGLDVAEAFYLSLKSSLKAEILNVGTGKPKSVNELANLISDNKIFIPWRPGEPKVTCAKISKIKNKLKWKPKAQFKNKIKELLDNINAWKKAPVWTRKKIKIATKKWNYYLK